MSRYVYLATLLTAIFCTVAVDAAVPSFSIYNSDPIATATFGMQLWGDRPDLAATAKYFPNRTLTAFCVTGIWALHIEAENYGSSPTLEYPYIFADSCHSFYNVWVGSARIVGEVGVQRLNLYSETFYKSNATVLTSSQATVSTKFSSMILAGHTSIQLYVQPNYGGLSYCLTANSTSYTRLANIESIGLKPGDVRSIRFGCSLDANVIEVQSVDEFVIV